MRIQSRSKLLLFGIALLLLPTVVQADPPQRRNFRAHLSGRNEVPVPVATNAQGQAIFQLSPDGSVLYYKLIVANINDVFMAHIHLAAADATGPIAVWLYPSAPPPQPIPGRTNGVLIQGAISSSNLIGPLAGMQLADLMNAIEAGNAYVNVHTPAYRAGEIRGQIR